VVVSCVSDGNVSDFNTLSIGSMAIVTPRGGGAKKIVGAEGV